MSEYLIVLLRERRAIWLGRTSASEKFSERSSEPDGALRSRVLPGLWLDADALFRGDLEAPSRVGRGGIASAEHGAFVARGR